MSLLAMSDYVLGAEAEVSRPERYVLWIDGVGAWLLSIGKAFTIGGPASDAAADLSLLANLSRKHATLERSGERYILHAHSPVSIAGRPIHERADLCDGNDLLFGTNVRMRFRLPSVMSGSARLEFLSDHRPGFAADGVVLMEDTCLLGPTVENHILCPRWPQSIILYRRDGQLFCKARDDLFINGAHTPAGGVLVPGTVVTGVEIRFRIEALR